MPIVAVDAASAAPALNRPPPIAAKSPLGRLRPPTYPSSASLLEDLLRKSGRRNDALELSSDQPYRPSSKRASGQAAAQLAAVCGLSFSTARIMSARKR